jgi:hypothetical protein
MKTHSHVPIEFKILIALRILGRDCDADTASELSGIAASSCNYFFKQFINGFSEALLEEWIKFPEGEEL